MGPAFYHKNESQMFHMFFINQSTPGNCRWGLSTRAWKSLVRSGRTAPTVAWCLKRPELLKDLVIDSDSWLENGGLNGWSVNPLYLRVPCSILGGRSQICFYDFHMVSIWLAFTIFLWFLFSMFFAYDFLTISLRFPFDFLMISRWCLFRAILIMFLDIFLIFLACLFLSF